jgi:hypothetical protein
MSAGGNSNGPSNIPEDVRRQGSTRYDDARAGSYSDGSCDLQDPDVRLTSVEGDTSGQRESRSPFV